FHPSIFRVPRNGAVNDAARFDLDPPAQGPLPPPFVKGDDGALWYITDDHKAARLDLTAAKLGPARVFGLPSPARALAKDSTGAIWVAADTELCKLTNGNFVSIGLENELEATGMRQMVPAPDGGLW